MPKRDYRLLGPDGARAVESGLAAAEWYHSDIPRKEMKALMKREDQPAIRDTILLLGCSDADDDDDGAAAEDAYWAIAYGAAVRKRASPAVCS